MFKTIRDNRNEILTVFLALIALFAGLFYGKEYFPPLAYALSFIYFWAIVAVVFATPWFAIRLTLPKTMGAFARDWFNAGWFSLGKPGNWQITKDCRSIRDDEPEEETLRASDLQVQLKYTLILYCVMLLVCAIIALTAFSQGISIPVLGG
jgi:hypothetical protein